MKRHFMKSFGALALALALLIASVPIAQADAPYYLYVSTGNSNGLNLRALPTGSSQSLGVYPNGTQVLVNGIVNGWAYVEVLSTRALGYMIMSCLTDDPGTPVYPINPPVPTENTLMYVCTGNSGKLNLRLYPCQSSPSLGLFPNGTQVVVTARTNGWAYVKVNGLYGYMMLAYLRTGSVQPTPQPQPGEKVLMYVRTGNAGKLHLRAFASQSAPSMGLFPNGTPVYARDLGNGWSEVTVYGLQGYMMSQFLVSYAPAPTATPAPTQAPSPTGQPLYEIRYVRTGNSGKLYLRQGMSTNSLILGKYPNGTLVTVLYDLGTWSYVLVNGQYGYMMRCYLADSPGAVVATPAPTQIPVPSGIAGTAAVVRNVNSSFVYLRSSKSSSTTLNVLARVPNGASVLVLEKGLFWSLILYDGIEGYMVSQYLQYE